MGESGYNKPDSGTWHVDQRCSGTYFSGFDAMDETVAKNRGLSPCGNCCNGEWPTDETEDGRTPDEWAEKAAEDGKALRLRGVGWKGPEWVTISDGTVYRYPVGLDGNVSPDNSRDPFDTDAEDSDIDKRVVDVTDSDEVPAEFIDAATEDE